MIAGSERGQANHVHQWKEIRGAPEWIVQYGFASSINYRLCLGCGECESIAEGD